MSTGIVAKGMVQVEGTTYRIVRISRGYYNVVRVLDDVGVGTFSAGASVELASVGIGAALMREIARVAIRGRRLAGPDVYRSASTELGNSANKVINALVTNQ